MAVAVRSCPRCGQPFAPDGDYCSRCGTERPSEARSRRPSWTQLAALSVAVVIIVALLGSYLLAAASLPDPNRLESVGVVADSQVFDRNGQMIASVHGAGGQHRVVPLRQVAPILRQATIATEDRSFYTNGGVDFGAIVRAAWVNVTHHGTVQGGSTITQQLAKLTITGSERSLWRKIKEAILAIEMTRRYSKDHILELYLNTVYYGNQSYGIETAAQNYFHLPAAKLSLAQSAMLAGLPQSPTAFNPLLHPEAASARQHDVLQNMVRAGMITPAQATAAAKVPLHVFPAQEYDRAPHFVTYVLDQLQARFGRDLLQRGGLRIDTTLDLELQDMAQKVVSQQVAALAGQNVHDGALVALNPKDGSILAMVGSADYNAAGGQYNMALVPRQPGSSFKIFTYTAAIDTHHLSMASHLLDAPFALATGGGPGGTGRYVVTDYDGRYHGWCLLGGCLGNSLNIPAVKVELKTGIPQVLAEARRMGLSALNQPDDSYGPSLTLGGYAVPLLEMASGAQTLAAGGVRYPPNAITRVRASDGALLYDGQARGQQLLDPRVAFIMNTMLSRNAYRTMEFGPASSLVLSGHQAAAKTGTTNNFKDNLTIGWTPNLLTAVWVGNADDSPMVRSSGITGAAPIWHDFMTAALAGAADAWYPAPGGLTVRSDPLGPLYLLPGTEQLPDTDVQSAPGENGVDHHKPKKKKP